MPHVCAFHLGAVTFKSLFLPHPPVNFVQQLGAELPEDDAIYTQISKGMSIALTRQTRCNFILIIFHHVLML